MPIALGGDVDPKEQPSSRVKMKRKHNKGVKMRGSDQRHESPTEDMAKVSICTIPNRKGFRTSCFHVPHGCQQWHCSCFHWRWWMRLWKERTQTQGHYIHVNNSRMNLHSSFLKARKILRVFKARCVIAEKEWSFSLTVRTCGFRAWAPSEVCRN